ncbi:hypothetical protein EZI54_16480 [Marinobacter halodurans]|uniref:SbsA Ig-like domain-containing protein n=1 Tax=Marinobacter halodurans TaxID=2528979 RepID=A0ABY1ZH76_9GAMM|nr:Ig-like domain-containing protein [Marinobacter halodurans]TBW52235.1 hypothetical protein EZI54_16480 [Marinobacter halodurans]
MKYNKILALAPALLLAACGGEEQTVSQPQTPGSVIYAYPADGQASISTKADVVLRFSNAITDEDVASKIRITADGGSSSVPFSVRKVDGGNSLVLAPDSELAPGTEYTISFAENLNAAGNRSVPTPNATGAAGVQFTTRGGLSGVAQLANLSADFKVVDTLPDGDTFKFMDFSTIRLRTSHPIHPESAVYGTTVSLLDGNGELVPATLLVSDNKLTVDPCTVDDPHQCGSADDQLDPDETYTLSINGLMDMKGNSLTYEKTFTPQETGPTEILYQKIVDSNFSEQSILDGQYVNAVTLNSVLQGTAGPSQQTGALYAELGYAPSFPGDTPVPLRVPKGTILQSTSLNVKINGSVPILNAETGQPQETGTIKVTMLSDAMGYLYPNPYSDDDEAPRHVRLWMDVSMNTEEAQPNASLSQDLLRVELTGIAIVKDGILTIDAIGMVEPNLLGQEYTDSTIAFHIEADTSEQTTAPDRPIDETGPELVSWMPGPEDAIPDTRQAMQRPGDPVVLNFDEPLDPDTVAAGVTLYADGTEVSDVRTKLDGTTIAVNPAGGLEHGVDYTLNINGSLTDVSGNGATTRTLSFALPDASTPSASPLAVTTYPGFPCVTTGVDLNANTHGQCKDKPFIDSGTAEGDVLPVTELPADRPIVVVFSQSMDLDSIRLGDTFKVESVDESGNATGEVSGRLEKNNQRIRFYPDQPWADGQAYRYTLVSAEDGDCANVICSVNGAALQTDILEGALDDSGNADIGGEPLVIYFRGSPSIQSVYTPLRNLPARDVNADFDIDSNEPADFPTEAAADGGYKPSSNAAKLKADGNPFILTEEGDSRVGCETTGPECPDKKFIYQTGALNTEVIGPVDKDDPSKGVRVLLYPTMLVASSIDVYLDGNALADVVLPPDQPQSTGPQMLRMRYADLDGDGNRTDLIPGVIYQTEKGPKFKTSAELLLDAPDLSLPLSSVLEHNLFSYNVPLDLEGDITFFNDGRMQIEQRNTNEPKLRVVVEIENAALDGAVDFLNCLGGIFSFPPNFNECNPDTSSASEGAVVIPLKIPENGVYLNFISNPIKEIPEDG